MINLIAPKEKEKLSMEKIKRMVIILWFLVFFFIICLVLVFLAVIIYAKSQLTTEQSKTVSAKKEFKKDIIADAESRVELVNSNLEKIDSFYSDKVYFSFLIEEISKTLPSNLYLNDFSIIFAEDLNNKGKEILKVSLAGFSPSRNDLLEFKSNLESEDNFTNVSFPSSNWVKQFNIDFSVSFEIKL